MFTAAQFTIIKTWKQPKCSSRKEHIKKMWYLYTMEYYSAIKKKEIMPFAATWMNLEIIILSEVNQRKTNIIYHLYVESKILIKMNLYTRHNITYIQDITNLWLLKGRGGYKLGVWD